MVPNRSDIPPEPAADAESRVAAIFEAELAMRRLRRRGLWGRLSPVWRIVFVVMMCLAAAGAITMAVVLLSIFKALLTPWLFSP